MFSLLELLIYMFFALLLGAVTMAFVIGSGEKIYTQKELDKLHDEWEKTFKSSFYRWSKVYKEQDDIIKKMANTIIDLRRRLNEA